MSGRVVDWMERMAGGRGLGLGGLNSVVEYHGGLQVEDRGVLHP